MLAIEFFRQLSKQEQRRWALAAMLMTITAGAIYVYLFDPAQGAGYVPCPFRLLTGFDCPGCGSLRGFHQLLHGHLWAAFRLNPLTMILLPAVGYSILSFTILAIRGWSLPRVFIPHRIIWLMLVVYISFWIVRNTPLYPFHA